MADQNSQEILEEIIIGINDMLGQTKDNRRLLRQLEAEIVRIHKSGQSTLLYYQIDMERVRRTQKDVDSCFKRLEQQKKIALWKLRELE